MWWFEFFFILFGHWSWFYCQIWILFLSLFVMPRHKVIKILFLRVVVWIETICPFQMRERIKNCILRIIMDKWMVKTTWFIIDFSCTWTHWIRKDLLHMKYFNEILIGLLKFNYSHFHDDKYIVMLSLNISFNLNAIISYTNQT